MHRQNTLWRLSGFRDVWSWNQKKKVAEGRISNFFVLHKMLERRSWCILSGEQFSKSDMVPSARTHTHTHTHSNVTANVFLFHTKLAAKTGMVTSCLTKMNRFIYNFLQQVWFGFSNDIDIEPCGTIWTLHQMNWWAQSRTGTGAVCVIGLWSYHLFLICSGITTRDTRHEKIWELHRSLTFGILETFTSCCILFASMSLGATFFYFRFGHVFFKSRYSWWDGTIFMVDRLID